MLFRKIIPFWGLKIFLENSVSGGLPVLEEFIKQIPQSSIRFNLMINLMTLNERTVLARWINGLKVPRISGRLMTKNQSPHLFLSHWMLFFPPFPLAQYKCTKVLFKASHFFHLSYFHWFLGCASSGGKRSLVSL